MKIKVHGYNLFGTPDDTHYKMTLNIRNGVIWERTSKEVPIIEDKDKLPGSYELRALPYTARTIRDINGKPVVATHTLTPAEGGELWVKLGYFKHQILLLDAGIHPLQNAKNFLSVLGSVLGFIFSIIALIRTFSVLVRHIEIPEYIYKHLL